MLRENWQRAIIGFVAALAVGRLAYTAMPAGDGATIECYSRTLTVMGPRESLRVVDAASDCHGDETALTWSRQDSPHAPDALGAPSPQRQIVPGAPPAPVFY